MKDNKKPVEEEKKEKKIEIQPPQDIEKKPQGLGGQMKELTEKFDMMVDAKKSKTKKKDFKLPAGMKGKLKKLAKKNKVQVLYLQHNRNIKPTTAEIKEGMLIVGDKIHDGSTDGIWLWNGKIPTMIVAEWDLKPVTPDRLLGKAIDDNSISHPQRIIIRAIELKEALGTGTKMSSKAIIWIMIGVAVVGYVLFANQGGG